MTVADVGIGVRFGVLVDRVQLPTFQTCEGLGAAYEIEEWAEGGANGYVHRLPGRAVYTPVRLTRTLDTSSGALAAWFSGAQDRRAFTNGRITAYQPSGAVLASWDLYSVWPSRYSAPVFSSTAQGVASESLELVHHGFTFGGSA